MATDGFAPLPDPIAQDGQSRRIGVEIEFCGLSEGDAAEIARGLLGGNARQDDSNGWVLTGTEIGDLEVYLDAAFLRDAEQSALRDAAMRIGREIIPIELVTAPLAPEDLPKLDSLVSALGKAGALGSSAGLLFGFGVHFNIQIASDRIKDIQRPLLAYALIEDWLRQAHPIDETRRVLPFTDPYPPDFVRELIGLGGGGKLDDLIQLYVAHNPTRNRGLDMLPIFAHLAPDVMAHLVTDSKSARPTFHFRLPDSQIDEPGWSLAQEWQRWIIVERVAADDELLDRLSLAWLDDHAGFTLLRRGWANRAGGILAQAGLIEQ